MITRMHTQPRTRSPWARWALLAITAVVALNAFGGAWYGLAGAQDVPERWLDGTPFDSYLVPSLILGIAVGGTQLAAALALALDHRRALQLTLLAATVLATWIVVQVAMIGYVSALQPLMFATALVMALLVAAAGREGDDADRLG